MTPAFSIIHHQNETTQLKVGYTLPGKFVEQFRFTLHKTNADDVPACIRAFSVYDIKAVSSQRDMHAAFLKSIESGVATKLTLEFLVNRLFDTGYAQTNILGYSLIDRPVYYGCRNDDSGHFCFTKGWGRNIDFMADRWLTQDGTLPPEDIHEKEGVAKYWFFPEKGVSCIAFWDRSVDHRFSSNSVFWFPGQVPREEILEKARAEWPEIFARFKFEVKLEASF